MSRVGLTITLLLVLGGCTSMTPTPSTGQSTPSGSSGIVPMPTAAWPELRPRAVHEAVAAALSMACQTEGTKVHCTAARDSGATFESTGPYNSSEPFSELEFKATGPLALESEAHRLWGAVADATTHSPELSTWWQDRMWVNVPRGSYQSETLPNGAWWSVAALENTTTDTIIWSLRIEWETTSEPTPIPTAPVSPSPSPVATQTPWRPFDYWVDDEFDARARSACLATAPSQLATINEPIDVLDRAPRDSKVRIVKTDLLGPDRQPQPFPSGMYDGVDEFDPPAFRIVVAMRPDEVDLLICVALRTGESGVYHVPNGGDITVYKFDAIVWPVDAASGQVAGRPWVRAWSESGWDQYLTNTVGNGIVALDFDPPAYWSSNLANDVLRFLDR